MTRIMKFGGTSVGDAAAMRETASILEEEHRQESVVAVVSAMSGTTNTLLDLGAEAVAGNSEAVETARAVLLNPHRRALSELVADGERRRRVSAALGMLVDDATRLLYSVYVLRELSPRATDRLVSFGERLSSVVLTAYLEELGVNAQQVDADRIIVTDGVFGNASPDLERTRQRVAGCLKPLVDRGCLPVVTGFFGATTEGLTTTLGRGGSDFSASILGYALDASEVWIWTDVDGVMTADPRLVPDARTIEFISYSEATELAYFGAKVIHPKTMYPAEEGRVPVRIKNTFSPDDSGTLISTETDSNAPAKAIASISGLAVITVEGRGLIDVSSVTMRIFEAVGRTGANVYMISQASSQHSVSFVVDGTARDAVLAALVGEFEQDLDRKRVLSLSSQNDAAIVAVVGAGMKGTPGVAGKVFGTMGSKGINIVAIAQGSSELNISFVVDGADVSDAVRALHNVFVAFEGTK
jgi:aspartokinase/homoserine dehydrogenase 1